jgi:hypothetical protein
MLRSSEELNKNVFYITNLSGQVLRTYNHPEGRQLIIERGDLNAGVYFLKKVGASGLIFTSKLVVCE